MVLWRELASWPVSECEVHIKSLKSAVSQISKRLQSHSSPSLPPLLVARFKWALVNAGLYRPGVPFRLCIYLSQWFIDSSANILDVTNLSLCPPMCICVSRVRPQSSRVRLLKVLNHQRDAGFVAATTSTYFDASNTMASPATLFVLCLWCITTVLTKTPLCVSLSRTFNGRVPSSEYGLIYNLCIRAR